MINRPIDPSITVNEMLRLYPATVSVLSFVLLATITPRPGVRAALGVA